MGEQTGDLLSGITTAHDLMHRVVGLQNRINQLTTQFATKTEKKTKRHPLLYAIAGFLVAFTLITSTPLKVITYPITIPFFATGGMELQMTVWNVVNLVISALIGAILYKVIARTADKSRAQRNAAIDQSNAQVEANNQALAQSIEQTKQEMINQQRIGNMLQLGNLFMQGQILSQAQQINTNTASASSNLDWNARRMGKR